MCKQKHCVCVCTCGDSAAWRTVCSVQQAVKFNLSVLISQPGILGWQNPIASLKHWDPSPPSPFLFLQWLPWLLQGKPKYHQSYATTCLHNDISLTWPDPAHVFSIFGPFSIFFSCK